VTDAEAYGIADDLWALYKQYQELFKLEESFKPDEYLITNDLESHAWDDLNLACVGSVVTCPPRK
jgi:hypothetical protein